MDHPNVIAWLLPSSTNQPAIEAVRLPQNTNRRIAAIPAAFDPSPLPSPNPDNTINPSLLTKKASSSSLTSKPRPALELSFANPPKNQTGFVLGTDADCDIVLPRLPGISPRHCALTFDAERRLVLRDTSAAGTAVWYDGASNGDRARESWVLSAGCTYGFPAMVDRIVIDIQTVRFQVIVNDWHLVDPEAYLRNVEDFMAILATLSAPSSFSSSFDGYNGSVHDLLASFNFDLGFDFSFSFDDEKENSDEDDYGAEYDRGFAYDYEMDVDEKRDALMPLPSEVAPQFVKYMFAADDGLPPDTYLWNTARPWEPMVKVTC